MPSAAGFAVEEYARAKVNLALHVTGRRGDGYHLLDSIVVFADLCDRVVLTPASRPELSLKGPFAAGVPQDGSNLALRAHEALAALYPGSIPPVRIEIEKNIPMAAGLGGGSSDAAATLRALCRIGGLSFGSPGVARAAAALGADVPVCLAAVPARLLGIGDRNQLLKPFGPLNAVLAMPERGVSTAEVYGKLDTSKELAGPADLGELPDRITVGWLSSRRNDLQAAATALVPEISTLCQALDAEPGAFFARMTGSGSACFALFDSERHSARAAAAIAADHPTWWVRNVVLNPPQ